MVPADLGYKCVGSFCSSISLLRRRLLFLLLVVAKTAGASSLLEHCTRWGKVTQIKNTVTEEGKFAFPSSSFLSSKVRVCAGTEVMLTSDRFAAAAATAIAPLAHNRTAQLKLIHLHSFTLHWRLMARR